MFSGITNLLFGSSSTTESAEVHVREDSPCGLKTQLTEDEWELVDERSRGNSPARLQSNPMENLLIEHPSMSVYGTRGRPSSTGHESDPESSSDTDMPVVEEEEDEGELTAARSGRKSVMSHSSGRSRVITAKQQLVAQQRAQKAMQALKKHKDSKKLAKSQIQRSNQVVHAQCGRPLRRKYHMQLRNSGAVNDRKSQ